MFELNQKLQNLTPYIPNEKKYRIYLDANESFLEMPDILRKEIHQGLDALLLNRYPDPLAAEACEAFAAYHGLPTKNIVAGNGSDELISVLFMSFLQKGERFATVSADFSMYAFYGRQCEVEHVEIPKNADLTIDPDAVIKTCKERDIRLLIFSNPCNPTSLGLERADVLRIVRELSALVVIDEAYMDFWDQSIVSCFADYDNLMILKTCSKAFGMAGVRLGFAVANDRLAGILKAAKSPYNVNSITQMVGAVTLRHKDLTESAIQDIINSKHELMAGVRKLQTEYGGFTALDSCTNFVSLQMEAPQSFHAYLGEKGIAVRFTEGLIRVTAGTRKENEAYLKAMREYLMKGC